MNKEIDLGKLRLIKFPLSKLSVKKLKDFRNDLSIEERVEAYNGIILNARKNKRNDKIKIKKLSKKQKEKDSLAKRNLEYFKKHSKTTNKKAFSKVLNELKNLQKSFNVIIHLKKRRWYKQNGEGYFEDVVFQRNITTKPQELDNKVADIINELYPFVDSYYIDYCESYDYKINKEFTHRTDKLDVPMRRAFPYKASFLQYMEKVNPISLQIGRGECVLDALCHHLQIKGKPMNNKNLKSEFNEASLNLYNVEYSKSRGITSRMILYVCKKKNISWLGFDHSNNVFLKHTCDNSR
jgi:hypothetical protein